MTAGLAVVMALEDEPGPRRLRVAGLCGLMALGFVIVAALPIGRDFFDLATPTGPMVASWAIGAVVTIVLLAIALRAVRVLDARAAQNA